MSYTAKNLRDVNDSAPEFGFSENQEARFPQKDLDAETTGLASHVIKPGKRQGFAHRHEKAEEVYVVLSGEGKLKLDDEVIDVGPMDAIRVAAGVARSWEAGPEGLEILAFGQHHPDDRGELITEGFWED